MEGSPRRTRKRQCGGACRASLYVCIGRLAGDPRDRWFVQVRDADHVGHPMVKCALLQKPSKFLDPDELAIATDVMSAQGSEGVARSLFYFRTGDTVSRNVLFRMKQLQANARLGLRSSPGPADALVEYVRNDPNLDYMLFYDEGNGNLSVTSELGLLGSDVARSQMSVTADQRAVIDDVRQATSLGSCVISMLVHCLGVRALTTYVSCDARVQTHPLVCFLASCGFVTMNVPSSGQTQAPSSLISPQIRTRKNCPFSWVPDSQFPTRALSYLGL